MSTKHCNVAIVAYSEIGLKSKPVRAKLEDMLLRHLRAALRKREVPFESIRKERGRIYICSGEPYAAAKAASHIFGVEYSAPACKTTIEMDAIVEAALKLAESTLTIGESFAVDARRVGVHPYTSKDLEVRIGSAVLDHLGRERGLRVDLKNPDKTIYVEAREKSAYIYSQFYEGLGGLPYGSQGKAVALLTCNVYSALAAWLMMKRGVEVIPVYLELQNSPDLRCRDEAIVLAESLREFVPVGRLELLFIPFDGVVDVIHSIAANCATFKVLYARASHAAASGICRLIGGEGIVAGYRPHPERGYHPELFLSLRESADVPIYCPLIALSGEEVSRLIGVLQLPTDLMSSGGVIEGVTCTETLGMNLERIKSLEARLGLRSKVYEAVERRRVVEISGAP
ncbi:MAG: THUMP domain-containing protein [Candidatus Bathyarchaeia archaeon]